MPLFELTENYSSLSLSLSLSRIFQYSMLYFTCKLSLVFFLIQGYGPHLTSTISEWIIAFLVCLYLATFTPEFKYFELIKPTISFREIPSKIVDVAGRSQDAEPQTNGLPVTLTQTDDKYKTELWWKNQEDLYMLSLRLLQLCQWLVA